MRQLLHAENLEEGMVDTVMPGGDTDTNARIAGALLGAVHGVDAMPAQWRGKLLNCRPEAERPRVQRRRRECLCPVDAVNIARCLVAGEQV
jgi:ADP-ribosylglycohydrolase